jgi:hypothetical protein
MKQKQRRTVSTGTNREAMPQKSRTGLPDLASATGRSVPTIEPAPVSAIWENDLFAVTKEGLVLKPPMVILIPKEHLPLVGSVAKSLPVKHSDTPFVEAIDHAVRIHFPAQFPDGLKSKREPEGPHND